MVKERVGGGGKSMKTRKINRKGGGRSGEDLERRTFPFQIVF